LSFVSYAALFAIQPGEYVRRFEHYAEQPARSLVAEIHKGCIQKQEKAAVTNQNLGD
jgi:hypothetical protein